MALLELGPCAGVMTVGASPPSRREDALLRMSCSGGVALGVVAGALHSVAMSLRKAGGNSNYVRTWQWWFGTLSDGTAGALFALSVPFAPAIVILPIVAISQMLAGQLLGALCFGEPLSGRSRLGLLCAMCSVCALGRHGPSAAVETVAVEGFWLQCAQLQFVLLNGAVLGMVLAARLSNRRATMYVLVSAHADGIQFLVTRTLAASFLSGQEALWPVLSLCCLKGACIVAFLHSQQLALAASLSQVAAIAPLLSACLPCLFSAAFFGDPFDWSPEAVLALAAGVAALVLLAPSPVKGLPLRVDTEPLLGG